MLNDASFSFLDRVKEIQLNIEDRRWQSALALALTIPDICGGIAFPDQYKRHRDGKIILDKFKNPARDTGGQYVRWFDEYASQYFKLSPDDESSYICGKRCWQLRCEYLHQNKGFLNNEDDDDVRFHLGVNCGTSVCQRDLDEHSDPLDIHIDIKEFCLRMCHAALDYYNNERESKDFDLYNTPVLDFMPIL